GAGIYLNQESSLTLINSTVTNNQITGATGSNRVGGGIYSRGGTLILIDAEISNNTSQLDGGGLYAAGGTIWLVNTDILENTSVSGTGGAMYLDGSTLRMFGGEISDNKSVGYG